MEDDTSTRDTECIHEIYPPTSCTICHPKLQSKPKPIADMHGKVRIAAFDGQCTDCNLPIYAGFSTIKNHKGVWYHKRCVDLMRKTNG